MTDLPHGEILSAARIDAAWLPIRNRLVRNEQAENLRIRLHRALRALEQAEALDGEESPAGARDVAFVFRWVALNALYGRWDEDRGMPTKDREAVDRFTSEASRVDHEGRLVASLERLTDEARTLLESPFLISRFWSDQEWDQVRPRVGRGKRFGEELREGRPGAAVHRLLMAVYFLRCQIVHGGATLGSRVNRIMVDPGGRVLTLLTPQLIALVAEKGLEMDWGELCYPPVTR